MPKSKRNKQIELAKTKKRGLDWKKKLFEQIRSCVDAYNNVFVFSVNDMRNSKMKNVREQWKDSRFFFGKNKIMAMALGRFAEEEYKPNIHKIGQRIKGERALLFSSRSSEDVLSWFRSYSEGDFARSGNIATEDVKLPAGPLAQFPHSLEPYLRQLGLPTSLVKGVIHLVKEHEVCKVGDVLTPETAKILKLLGYEMAEFHITINCMWSKDGTFLQFTEEVDDTKENKKKKKKNMKSDSFSNKQNSLVKEDSKIEEMEIEEDDAMSDSSAPELINDICNTPKATTEEDKKSDLLFENTSLSSPKDTASLQKDEKTDEDNDIELSRETSAKRNIENILDELNEDKEDINLKSSNTPKNTDEVLAESLTELNMVKHKDVELFDETPAKKKKNTALDELNEEISNKNCSTPKDDNDVLTQNSNKDDNDEKGIELSLVTPISKNKNKVLDSNNENESKRHSRLRHHANDSKKEAVPKTPDMANSSQESPVFRELRSRSVKVNRKRNK